MLGKAKSIWSGGGKRSYRYKGPILSGTRGLQGEQPGGAAVEKGRGREQFFYCSWIQAVGLTSKEKSFDREWKPCSHYVGGPKGTGS